MPLHSNSQDDKRIIKRLEKQSDRHRQEISDHRAVINNMKIVNKSITEENQYLKNFIRDLERKSHIISENNINQTHGFNNKIETLNKNHTENHRKMKIMETKLNNSEKLNIKFKKVINNNMKKIHDIEQENDMIHQKHNILQTQYNNLLYEYRCFMRDLELELEESQPLLNNSENMELYQIDKVKRYSLANFKFEKKIENKNKNKDNITFLYKPMSKASNAGGFPTLFSELQNFLNVPPTQPTSRSGNAEQKYIDEVQTINKKIVTENQSLRNERYKLQIQ